MVVLAIVVAVLATVTAPAAAIVLPVSPAVTSAMRLKAAAKLLDLDLPKLEREAKERAAGSLKDAEAEGKTAGVAGVTPKKAPRRSRSPRRATAGAWCRSPPRCAT